MFEILEPFLSLLPLLSKSVVSDFDTILKLTFMSLKWPYHAYVLIEPIINSLFIKSRKEYN